MVAYSRLLYSASHTLNVEGKSKEVVTAAALVVVEHTSEFCFIEREGAY